MTEEHLCLAMPCVPSYARVARTAAAACGVLEGFSVEELGDLRLLVDEVFTAMYELGVRRLELRLTPVDGDVGVLMAATGPIGDPRGEADVRFAETLASVVATKVNFDLANVTPTFTATVSAS